MRKLVVAAVAALAFLAPSSAHAIGFVGARVGYAMPSGDAQQGAGRNLDGVLGEQGDTVEALLAHDLDFVAGGLDLEPRELRFLRLDLLQHHDVGLRLLQP